MASTVASSALTRAPTGGDTQAKLNVLTEHFNTFFGDLEEETAVRKKAEDTRLVRLDKELSRIEKSISAESRRRIDAVKAVQVQFEERLEALQQSFKDQLKGNTEAIQRELAGLREKIIALEKRMDDERESREREIQKHNRTVLEKFEEHTKEFEIEKVLIRKGTASGHVPVIQAPSHTLAGDSAGARSSAPEACG